MAMDNEGMDEPRGTNVEKEYKCINSKDNNNSNKTQQTTHKRNFQSAIVKMPASISRIAMCDPPTPSPEPYSF